MKCGAGLIAGLALVGVQPAMAAPAALEDAFRGTVVSTYPDGRIGRLWLNRNGTFTAEGRRHTRSSGRWRVRGDQVCFRRGLFGYCTRIPGSTGSFTTRAVTGETIRVRLVAGRAGEER